MAAVSHLRLVMTEQQERDAVVDRVAAAIWEANHYSEVLPWTRAKRMAGLDGGASTSDAIKREVERVHRQARAAIGALAIGDDGLWPGAERMLQAGASVFAEVSAGQVALMLDVMLAEVLDRDGLNSVMTAAAQAGAAEMDEADG